jgi:hypothetical protein
MNQQNMVYILKEMLLRLKKKQILTQDKTWMKLESILKKSVTKIHKMYETVAMRIIAPSES